MKNIVFVFMLSNIGFVSSALADIACFKVDGMTCATCPITVKTAVKKLNGVTDVKASLEEGSAEINFDPQKTNAGEIKKTIDNVGYKAVSQNCKKGKG